MIIALYLNALISIVVGRTLFGNNLVVPLTRPTDFSRESFVWNNLKPYVAVKRVNIKGNSYGGIHAWKTGNIPLGVRHVIHGKLHNDLNLSKRSNIESYKSGNQLSVTVPVHSDENLERSQNEGFQSAGHDNNFSSNNEDYQPTSVVQDTYEKSNLIEKPTYSSLIEHQESNSHQPGYEPSNENMKEDQQSDFTAVDTQYSEKDTSKENDGHFSRYSIMEMEPVIDANELFPNFHTEFVPQKSDDEPLSGTRSYRPTVPIRFANQYENLANDAPYSKETMLTKIMMCIDRHLRGFPCTQVPGERESQILHYSPLKHPKNDVSRSLFMNEHETNHWEDVPQPTFELFKQNRQLTPISSSNVPTTKDSLVEKPKEVIDSRKQLTPFYEPQIRNTECPSTIKPDPPRLNIFICERLPTSFEGDEQYFDASGNVYEAPYLPNNFDSQLPSANYLSNVWPWEATPQANDELLQRNQRNKRSINLLSTDKEFDNYLPSNPIALPVKFKMYVLGHNALFLVPEEQPSNNDVPSYSPKLKIYPLLDTNQFYQKYFEPIRYDRSMFKKLQTPPVELESDIKDSLEASQYYTTLPFLLGSNDSK